MILDPASAVVLAYLPSHTTIRIAVLAIVLALAAGCLRHGHAPTARGSGRKRPIGDRGGFH